MSEDIWKLVRRLERVVAWLKSTTRGRIVVAIAIVALGVIVALITSEPAYGGWTILLQIIGLGLVAIVRRIKGAVNQSDHAIAVGGGSAMNDFEEHPRLDEIDSNEISSAEIQRARLEAEIQRARLEAEVRRARRKKVSPAAIVGLLLIVIFVGFGYVLVNVYTKAHGNELLAAELAEQVDLLEGALAQTVSPQDLDEQIQSLAQEVEFLRHKIDSELEASKISMEAMGEANNRIFFLFVFLSGVGSFFGIATWYSGRQEQQEEKERGRAMFALQERNLEEVNTITTAIAAGATQNVDSLNTMLATFQRIMDFKVTEAENVQELMQEMRGELDELKEAQRQQVEELLRKAVALRRPRSIYSSPDPDLHRQMVEFRTQMDLMQWVILDRYTGAESPKAENRRYGEIYLRRGVIAYLENDVTKSREMLTIAEGFFPFLEQEIESMLRDQKIHTAFTQFYLALIQKNYGDMAAAREHIERSYTVHGRKEQDELLTTVTRAEILSYLGDMDGAQAAIQEVLNRTDNLQQRGALEQHGAIYALRAHLLLGNTYYVRGEWDQALQHYQNVLKENVRQVYSYYAYHSIAQVYHQLGNEAEAKENKRRAYKELLDTDHLRTKVALDTQILLNALAYRCTHEDMPEMAQTYRGTIRELWLRIHEVNGLQLRLFSFEKKQPVSKDEFWDEVFGG